MVELAVDWGLCLCDDGGLDDVMDGVFGGCIFIIYSELENPIWFIRCVEEFS